MKIVCSIVVLSIRLFTLRIAGTCFTFSSCTRIFRNYFRMIDSGVCFLPRLAFPGH